MLSEPRKSDYAKVLAPAPIIYIIAFLLGLALHYFFRIALMPFQYALSIGVLMMLVSIPIVVAAVNEMLNAGTAFDVRKRTTVLVTSGIFRISRNPTYLALTILFTGLAFAVNSIIILLFVIIAANVTLFGVILPEEKYLKGKFGDEYMKYRKRVRRWI